MKSIRVCVRTVALLVWLAAAALLVVLAAILTLGRRSAISATCASVMRGFSTGLCAILGIRVTFEGALPRGACLVAPNHWGYTDVLVLGSIYGGRFVSRADVAGWPVLGFFARAAGTLFLDRETRRDAARVVADVASELIGGRRVTVFLEGSAGDGGSVRKFKSSLVEAAVATGAPCVGAAIVYSLPRDPDISPRDVVAWIDGGFVGHLMRVMSMRRVDAQVTFLPPRTGTQRKLLARKLEDDVRSVIERSTSSVTFADRTPGPSASLP